MIVLGIDPGFSITGWAIISKQGNKQILLAYGFLPLPAKKHLHERIGIFYDFFSEKIKVYNGINFKTLGSIEYGATSPAGQLLGDQWFNTVTNQLFVYDGTEHKLIGPLLTNPNAAQLTSKRLIDTGGNIRTVLQANFEDSTIAMFSKDEFDINSTQTPVIGFSKIFKGITLPSRLVYPNVKFGGVAKTCWKL
jgi:hypothetical protein